LLIPHPNGIVIHPEAKIGVNCLIFHQVTLGSRSASGVPSIGGHVDIGAGAKILGLVNVGAHARIGANAVILNDVDPGTVAAGIEHEFTMLPISAAASLCYDIQFVITSKSVRAYLKTL
jgi:serine acetyltransferase